MNFEFSLFPLTRHCTLLKLYNGYWCLYEAGLFLSSFVCIVCLIYWCCLHIWRIHSQ